MNRFKMLRVINLKLHWFRTLHFAITTDFGPISYEGSLICRLSCETKQYPIRKRADKDGSITNIAVADLGFFKGRGHNLQRGAEYNAIFLDYFVTWH